MAIYTEGDWYAIPLRDGRFARGVVARSADHSCVLGYFFGPTTDSPIDGTAIERLPSAEAVLVCRFGDLALVRDDWSRIAHDPTFARAHWPMPVFARFPELEDDAMLVHYDDGDPLKVVKEERVELRLAADHPRDDLYGAGAVEIVLTDRLRT